MRTVYLPCSNLFKCVGIVAVALTMLEPSVVLGDAASAKSAKRGEVTTTKYAKLSPVIFTSVVVHDNFWKPRMETIRTKTVPDLLKMSESRIRNFAVIAGLEKGKIWAANSPDSDLYKVIQSAAYTLAWRPDTRLDKQLDDIIAKVAAARADDGYLNTQYMLPLGHPAFPGLNRQAMRYGYGPTQQWKGRISEWPKGIGQFYCAGHLFEAAAVHYWATGKRNLLDVACKLADHINRVFGPGKPFEYADHPQVGIGLVKLYQATGEKRYLKLAEFIIHNGDHARPPDKGNGESHKPIRQQRKAWGHCVRTMYLYSGLADLVGHLDDEPSRVALESLWNSVVGRKMYITGGIGDGTPAEQHGDDYHLPNDKAYCECCASIAMGMWNHRMNLLYGDARYADLVELEAYNSALSGISLGGTEYFYQNKLAVGRQHRRRRRYIFCCPTNLPRFIAGIGRWVYAQDKDGIYVNMYIAGAANITLGEDAVQIKQKTHYPWDGKIAISVELENTKTFDVCLRIPGWAQDRPVPSDLYRFSEADAPPVTLKVNGKTIATPETQKGYVRVHRHWKKGDTVELNLPMPLRRVYAHPNVRADIGRVALMRGPLVYCLEAADNNGSVFNLSLPDDAELTAQHRDDLLGGVRVLHGKGLRDGKTPVEITAVPYYAWDNRDIGEMLVWLPEK